MDGWDRKMFVYVIGGGQVTEIHQFNGEEKNRWIIRMFHCTVGHDCVHNDIN